MPRQWCETSGTRCEVSAILSRFRCIPSCAGRSGPPSLTRPALAFSGGSLDLDDETHTHNHLTSQFQPETDVLLSPPSVSLRRPSSPDPVSPLSYRGRRWSENPVSGKTVSTGILDRVGLLESLSIFQFKISWSTYTDEFT